MPPVTISFTFPTEADALAVRRMLCRRSNPAIKPSEETLALAKRVQGESWNADVLRERQAEAAFAPLTIE